VAFLAAEAAHGRVDAGGILMLTPCHETPGYSHLHAPVPLRILDCSPRTDGAATERDSFFAAPAAYLESRVLGSAAAAAAPMTAATLDGGGVAWAERVGAVPPPRGPPSHVVLFDDMAAAVQPQLAAHGYELRRSFFHAHFAVDRDQRALLVYVRNPGR
jgi:phosphatidylinositol glycan class B